MRVGNNRRGPNAPQAPDGVVLISTWYGVARDGSVWSATDSGWRMLRQIEIARYQYVSISVDGVAKHRSVHSLVLGAFVGPRPDGMEAAHLDGDPRNNSIDNLAWVTPAENAAHKMKHGTHRMGTRHCGARLTETDVCEIRRLAASGVRLADLRRRYGVSESTARNAIRGVTWKHVNEPPVPLCDLDVCRQGHDMSLTRRTTPSGKTYCRECNRERNRSKRKNHLRTTYATPNEERAA